MYRSLAPGARIVRPDAEKDITDSHLECSSFQHGSTLEHMVVKAVRHNPERRRAASFSALLPGVVHPITIPNPAFHRGACLHYLPKGKAAAFSCLSLQKGVISDGTRTTRSTPARGKPLTGSCSVLCIDCAYYDALSYATRYPYEKGPLFAISSRKTRYGSGT
jgi:hypothetical protein